MNYVTGLTSPGVRHALIEMGVGHGTDIVESHSAVSRYLKASRKAKQKYNELICQCKEILQEELGNLEWGDECFEHYCREMFQGAHSSQLRHFKSGYIRSKNKRKYFLHYVKHEL